MKKEEYIELRKDIINKRQEACKLYDLQREKLDQEYIKANCEYKKGDLICFEFSDTHKEVYVIDSLYLTGEQDVCFHGRIRKENGEFHWNRTSCFLSQTFAKKTYKVIES